MRPRALPIAGGGNHRGDVRETGLARSGSFEKLVWQSAADKATFELAVESPIPKGQTAVEVEAQLAAELALVWQDKAKAIVIDPELETWIWGSDNALQAALDWPLLQSIRAWLTQQSYAVGSNGKPDQPKAAFGALVPVQELPRSSAPYESITLKISLESCQDEVFQRLKHTSRRWFPASGA